MDVTKADVHKLRAQIFHWWKNHHRDLPWRHTHDPYKILISEVMLQQTQVGRVVPKYTEFLRQYPTVTDLAAASTSDVLRLWKGMGYNKRALYLKKAAQKVVQEYGGIFPKSEIKLRKLPGLGIYTARAILVFAYRKNVAMVDTNIRQIITHFFFQDKFQKESVILKVADQLVPRGKSWEWHQALMDYGALELSKQGVPKKVNKLTMPFRQSNRFYRGRIMDHLRQGGWEEAALIHIAIDLYGKTEEFYAMLIQGLIADGLVVKIGNRVSLPD